MGLASLMLRSTPGRLTVGDDEPKKTSDDPRDGIPLKNETKSFREEEAERSRDVERERRSDK